MKTLRVLATLLLCSFSSIQSEGPHCFECTGVPYPRDCANIILCGANELCSTEQIVTTSGHVVYNTGCRDKERCTPYSSELMGKRHVNITAEDTSDISTCVQCCNESFCNNKGCDVIRDQRGPYCYNCDSTLDPQSCMHVAVCQKNEECVLYSPSEFSGLPETVYRSHCLTKVGCEALSTAYSNYRCPPMCCGTDFCNDHCGTVSNSSMSTPAPYTTVHNTHSVSNVQTTGTSSSTHATHTTSQHKPTTAGHTHASQSECNHDGYIYLQPNHDHLCVHVITNLQYNWTSARSQCQKEHGDLVVLDTHEKAHIMREYIRKNNHDIDIFWIGGKDFNQDDTYYWVNGSPIGPDGDWTNGQPNHHASNEVQDCVSMNKDSERHFHWHDTGCQHHHAFICEH